MILCYVIHLSHQGLMPTFEVPIVLLAVEILGHRNLQRLLADNFRYIKLQVARHAKFHLGHVHIMLIVVEGVYQVGLVPEPLQILLLRKELSALRN